MFVIENKLSLSDRMGGTTRCITLNRRRLPDTEYRLFKRLVLDSLI